MAVFMEPSSSKSQGMKSLNENRTPLRRAGWVAVVYLIAGFAWIAFSDTLAETWFPDPKTLSVIQTWKGSFFRLDDHIDRFLNSCSGMRIACPYAKAEIKEILAECTDRAGLEDAYVEVLTTRGRFTVLGSRDLRQTRPTFIA